jgi:hypothetical protein
VLEEFLDSQPEIFDDSTDGSPLEITGVDGHHNAAPVGFAEINGMPSALAVELES